MLNKSFTGSKVNYVVLQARVSGDTLHIQGSGKEINRSYGVAQNVPLVKFGADTDWLDTLDTNNDSLAGTNKKYFEFQAKIQSDTLHIQIPGPEFNRDYGLSMNVPQGVMPDVTKFVKAELG